MNESIEQLVVSQVIQVTVVASIALLICKFSRQRSPRFAYLLCLVAMLSFVVPPVVFSPLPSIGSVIKERVNHLGNTASHRNVDRPFLAVNAEGEIGSWMLPIQPVAPILIEETTGELNSEQVPGILLSVPRKERTDAISPVWRWTFLFVAFVYIGGILVTAFRDLIRFARIRHKLARDSQTVPPEAVRMFSSLARQICPLREVKLLVVNEEIGPASFGVWRPTVVLPKSFLGHVDLDLMLAHELVHVRRLDSLASIMQMVCRWVWWFHPLVWFLSSQTNHLRESLVDAEVIARSRSGAQRYAGCLLEIANSTHRQNGLLFAYNQMGAVSKRQLENRLRLILGEPLKSRTDLFYGLLFALFLIAAIPDYSHSIGEDVQNGLSRSPGFESGLVEVLFSGAWTTVGPQSNQNTPLAMPAHNRTTDGFWRERHQSCTGCDRLYEIAPAKVILGKFMPQ